jgi:hypothetical protein
MKVVWGVIDIEKQNQALATAKEFTQVRHPLGSSHLGEALP